MEKQPLHILFLPRWYPNRYDPMPGLFIQRQAEALAVRHEVLVLYLHPDPDAPNRFEIDYAEENRVHVIRVYYRVSGSSSPLTSLAKATAFWMAFRRGWEMTGGFQPDIVHSHILTRTALSGWRLARKFGVPHILSEHWSRYFPENGTYRGVFRKWITRLVVSRSDALIAVSEKLRGALENQGLHGPGLKPGAMEIIPNIIPSGWSPLSFPLKPHEGKRILHVSCFEDKSKNISGFLEALALLYTYRQDFTCTLIGEGPDLEQMKQRASALGLTEPVLRFAGLIEGEALADQYRESDVTVVTSRYETFGTVIIESLACGTPVLSTDVGVAGEVIKEGNGALITQTDPTGIAMAIHEFLNRIPVSTPEEISKGIAERYAPETVAALLEEIYRKRIAHD